MSQMNTNANAHTNFKQQYKALKNSYQQLHMKNKKMNGQNVTNE